MRLEIPDPSDALPFVPLQDSPFPPLPAEYRAALRTQRGLEGGISVLSGHQGAAQAALTRLRDDLRAQGSRITLAREKKTLAEVQGADTAGPEKELAAAERKRAQIEADIAQMERDIAARAQAIQARQSALADNRREVERAQNIYRQQARDALVGQNSQILEWFRLWGAYRGNVGFDSKHWWLNVFLGVTVADVITAMQEGERQHDAWLDSHPLTGEDDAR